MNSAIDTLNGKLNEVGTASYVDTNYNNNGGGSGGHYHETSKMSTSIKQHHLNETDI